MRSFLRPHTRFMLVYWPGLLVFLLLLRLALAGSEGLAPLNNVWQKSRIRQGLAAIRNGRVAAPEGSKLVLMLGASESLLAFHPGRFDSLAAARGFTARSFNLSFQNTGTMIPLYFERVRREMEAASLRAHVVLVSIPVPRLTRRARETFFAQSRYHDIDAVFFEPGLWSRVGLPLADKLILLFNKWALGERSLVQLQRSFVQLSRALVPGTEQRASAKPFYREEIHPEPAWDIESRGGYYFNMEKEPELAEELLAAAMEPRAMGEDLRDLIRCCDVLDLRLDEDYVREVAAAVRALSAVAERVAVVSYPESPRLERKAEARERAGATLAFIARESGAELWDAAGAGLEARDYFDLSHLTPSGVEKLNRFLVSKVTAGPGEAR